MRPAFGTVARLRAAGCVFAEDEAALLEESADSPAALEAAVTRRVSGEPLEQILGWVSFFGARLVVRPGVFVPRRRTELLARQTLSALDAAAESEQPRQRPPVVVELCCGVAPVAATITRLRPQASVFAADLDETACAGAQLNARTATIRCGDLYGALPPDLAGRVDVLAVNAPYVPSAEVSLMPPEARDHEPLLALDGGPDGLDVQRRVVVEAGRWLSRTGVLLIETGRRQSAATATLMRTSGLVAEVVTDDDLSATVVRGTRPR